MLLAKAQAIFCARFTLVLPAKVLCMMLSIRYYMYYKHYI